MGQEENQKENIFMRTTLVLCDPAVMNLQGVFMRDIPLRPPSNDLKILKRTE